ncbi:PadR family transcriptional regulator [Nocardia sp. SSK8]|uniref:PadR family transcriptional regulator n=1 Tax=Nocardia sp. SSK8 TaxID=3120154 RepID=UPI0030091FA9
MQRGLRGEEGEHGEHHEEHGRAELEHERVEPHSPTPPHRHLGLLAERPASGYDLLGRFKESLANVWPATQSQIYTELTKLAATARITVSDHGPRGRKEYTITPQGRADLHTWLTDPTPPPPARNETLLRAFFLDTPHPRRSHHLPHHPRIPLHHRPHHPPDRQVHHRLDRHPPGHQRPPGPRMGRALPPHEPGVGTVGKTAGHLGDLDSCTASDNLLAHQQVRVAEWQTR